MTQTDAEKDKKVRLAVLGLGRLGGSLGLALRSQPAVQVIGFDFDAGLAKMAQSRGVVERAEWSLPKAVSGTDLVIVAVPLAEQRELLQLLRPELREGAVLASLAPLLGQPLAWAAEALAGSEGRHFVACHASLNPTQLHSGDSGLEAARADLFAGGLWALAPAPGCAPEALRLVSDLAQLLGASAYFVDPDEHDGLAAASEALPAVLAWALLQAAMASPGWPETRKLAERSFATATAALVDADVAALSANRDNLLRYLDAALAELQQFRGWLAQDTAGDVLHHALAEATDRRAAWLLQRQRGDWEKLDSPQIPPPGGSQLGRMLLGGLGRGKGK